MCISGEGGRRRRIGQTEENDGGSIDVCAAHVRGVHTHTQP